MLPSEGTWLPVFFDEKTMNHNCGHQATGTPGATWPPAPPATVPMVQFELPNNGMAPSPAAPSAQSPSSADLAQDDDAVIARAIAILEDRMRKVSVLIGTPSAAKEYVRLQLGGLDHEVFGVGFLDSQNRLIEFRRMFTGTLTQTSVYPREVVKAVLEVNAASVLLTHNHPSGICDPSRADEKLTHALKSALALVDVRVMDHIVVAASGTFSFAERGLL